jgi:hypothetical protein
MGFPGAFGINFKEANGDWSKILSMIEAAAIFQGASGRIGTWAYSLGFCHTAALAEFGKQNMEGFSKIDDLDKLLDCYKKYSPEADWKKTVYFDNKNGQEYKNFILISQDIYILGRGFMEVTKIPVPEKYRQIEYTH